MSTALRIANKAMRYLRISPSKVQKNSKGFSKVLQSVVSGKPKKEKKAILKLYESYIQNPNNKELESRFRDVIASSKPVKNAAQIGGGIFNDLNRVTATYSLENSLISPIRRQNTFEQVKQEAVTSLRKTLSEISAPEININTEEIVKQVIKESRKDSLKLAGRGIMYPINKAISMFFNKNNKKILSEVIHLPKSEFGTAYYKKLLEATNLTKTAPKEINILPKSARLNIQNLITNYKYNCEGGFNLMNNTIELTKEFHTLPKHIQANIITHELKHFQQADQVIRTFGIERYIQAIKQNTIKTLKNSKQFAGKTTQEIQKYIEKEWTEKGIEKGIRKAFAESINGTKISADSNLGKQAEKYLHAIEQYSAPSQNNFLVDITPEYKNNLLEKEAYRTGKAAMFRTFIMNNLNFKTI